MKLFIAFIIILTMSLAAAENGCFFYLESPFHCTDIDRVQAQQECATFQNCVFTSAFIGGDRCSDYLDCQAESTASNQDLSLFWLVIAAVLLMIAGYFAIKAGLLNIIKNRLSKAPKEVPSTTSNIWDFFSPFASSSTVKYKLRVAKIKHKHQLNQQKRKNFFTNLGLAIPDRKTDEFLKLDQAYKFYEKRRQKINQKLSKNELRVFHNLEQVVEKLKQKNTFNLSPVPVKKDVKKILNELRGLAGKK
ncbi:MAG TPA: hypothetical protein VJI98_01500 [Candidatus Nanoarchaeia archaeon]|nr:hypothetical protein [Candidatus Nanoarchaeia archaeon]